jgi:hypothetical protein
MAATAWEQRASAQLVRMGEQSTTAVAFTSSPIPSQVVSVHHIKEKATKSHNVRHAVVHFMETFGPDVVLFFYISYFIIHGHFFLSLCDRGMDET